MPNMPYVRFQNTLADLHDCERALDRDGIEGLSDEELLAALNLIKLCKTIHDEFGYLEEEL